MDALLLISRTAAARFNGSDFRQYIPSYLDRLHSLGYSQSTTSHYLSGVSHFSRWCTQNRRGIKEIGDADLVRFLEHHLPRCNCPAPIQRGPHQLRAAIRQFLVIVRQFTSSEPPVLTPARAELLRFDAYLLKTKGLAASTRARRLVIVGELLSYQQQESIPTNLNPQTLRKCLQAQRSRLSPASAGVFAGALRSYIKYRITLGDDVGYLLPIILSPANWRLAPLPQTLNATQVEQLLTAFPPDFPSRRRGYAIVRCLVDLGLRTSEVASIKLDDIDWHAATLKITKNKSRRVDILPLPTLTSKAIAEYIQFERPHSGLRQLFVRHVAPINQPISISVIRNTVRNAYLRCELPFTRVHILRNTLASRILAKGGTLKEVTDVLRHRHLDTSLIYTKIDFTRLALVTQPWPGSAT
jgi:site-specific recombinase XerD